MNVRVYFNTGFNAVNIPDTPALLDSGAFTVTDFPAIDVLQERFLSSIRIRATWNQIKNGDYCRITDLSDNYDFYYTIDGISMKAQDVAELHLIPDFVTSAGGLENCDILDGVATRCHVDDDTYGAWELDDEYLTPSEPLAMDTATIDFSGNNIEVVESSLDLGLMANIATADSFEDDNGESVMVPRAYTSLTETEYTLDGHNATNLRTVVYPLNTGSVREGIEMCRALGIESAVVNTAKMPATLVSGTLGTEYIQATQAGEAINTVGSGSVATARTIKANNIPATLDEHWNVYTDLEGQFVESDSTLLFEYDNTVKNKRVLYGNINKVGILTTAGNRLEANPESLIGGGETTIKIKSVGDPHTNGAPYHRFKYMDGNASNQGFWLNAVKGLQWKQIPLMYATKSGSILDRIDFDNSRAVADLTYDQKTRGLDGFAGGMIAGLGGALAGAFGGLMTMGIPGAIVGGITGGMGGLGAGYFNYQDASEQYKLAKKNEMQQFGVSQNVVAPQISVSYDGEAYRDFYGECVIVYRYRPRPTDLARMDKILTMYGYRLNVPACDAPLHNRTYFNYIQASITVGGSLPKWLADGVAIQVSNGVRLWHVKPDSSYYANNPIII